MPVLDFPDLGLIDVPEGADIGKAAEAAKRFVRTTKTSPSPQPMTSAQMNVQPVQPATPLAAAVPTIQTAIPQDAGLRAQSETDKLRQYRDNIGRMIAPLVGLNFDEMSGEAAKGILRQVIAFHGSPHTFDKFDASKIGTGEGAQAYGHGLYFAENPAVAGDYQRTLSRKLGNIQVDGVPLHETTLSPGARSYADMIGNDPSFNLDGLIEQNKRSLANAEAELAQYPSSQVGDANARMARRHLAALEELQGSEIKAMPKPKGSLYTVTVPDEHANAMLDWDKPLNEQPGLIAKLKNLPTEQWWSKPGGDRISGENLYRQLTEDLSGQPQASKALQDAGIPGIKYLDQGSRGIIQPPTQIEMLDGSAGWAVDSPTGTRQFTDKASADQFYRSLGPQKQGTRNFVVFDPSILQDVKRQ